LPDPSTSAVGRWDVLGAYGSKLVEGRSRSSAEAFVSALLTHVVAMPSSAQEALAAFATGEGDALVSYEQQAITGERRSEGIEYVIPKNTILVQNPVAVVGRSVDARRFVAFMSSPAGQQIWAADGFRSVVGELVDTRRFPPPPGLFTVAELGGWRAVQQRFFDQATGLVARIERRTGTAPGT
jgi:sulfate transport system substrate-binding protein